MPAKSGVMIPFGSSEKKVRVVMNDLLSIYLRTMLANHPMPSSNTSDTSLNWVSAVNNTC